MKKYSVLHYAIGVCVGYFIGLGFENWCQWVLTKSVWIYFHQFWIDPLLSVTGFINRATVAVALPVLMYCGHWTNNKKTSVANPIVIPPPVQEPPIQFSIHTKQAKRHQPVDLARVLELRDERQLNFVLFWGVAFVLAAAAIAVCR